jgi:RNA recognition motif-containing protein
VGDDALSRIFRTYPGMEYCDLKKDRLSGRSKGYAYVSYATPEAAAAAQAQLNGADFPAGSGYRLKVGAARGSGAAAHAALRQRTLCCGSVLPGGG